MTLLKPIIYRIRTCRKMLHFFLPSTLLEWDKLDRRISQSTTMMIFKNALLKIGRPTSKPVYYIHDPNGLKLVTRLRLGLNHLNEHKFNNNFKVGVSLLCCCSLEVEPAFFLHCHYSQSQIYTLIITQHF